MTYLAFDNAKTGILANKRSMDVVSQNISNASRETYSRQSAVQRSNNPIQEGRLQFGTGVNVDAIDRARDQFLDARFREGSQTLGRFQQLEDVFQQVESFLDEPSDNGIRENFSNFFGSLQTLANDPENRGSRQNVVGNAEGFANVLQRATTQLRDIAGRGGAGGSATEQIESMVEEVNNIGDNIASLNNEIATAKATGGNPNDLLDQRDAAIDELSKITDIEVVGNGGNLRVNVMGRTLVQGNSTTEFGLRRGDDEGKPEVFYKGSTEPTVNPTRGKLGALFEARDEVVPKLIDQINDLAVQFVDRFNDQHKAGFGLQGQSRNNFFNELPTREDGVFRAEGMSITEGPFDDREAGYIDSPEVELAGDPDSPDRENFQEDDAVQANPEGTLLIHDDSINYDMTEDSIKDVIDKINEADNDASAYLSAENRLVIKGTQERNYEIENMTDTGLLLDKANIATAGGQDRTGQNDVNPTATLDGEVNLGPGGSALETDGLLQIESTAESETLEVEYDATTDSLNDVVTRINDAANDPSANASNSGDFAAGDDFQVAAEVTANDRLRIYSSETAPGAGAGTNPTVDVAEDASFQVNDTLQDGDPNSKGNLLNELGMFTQYNGSQEQEFAFTGETRRPPQKDQVFGMEVNQLVQSNPDVVAASDGLDTRGDGIPDQSKGPGDGENAQNLANLKGAEIMREGEQSPDGALRSMLSELGNDSSLAQRERESVQALVDDVSRQRQEVSGVSIDEEMTRMLQFQQVFQASTRIVQTVQEMNSSLLQVV